MTLFVGPSYALEDRKASACRTVNMVLRPMEVGGKSVATLKAWPGMTLAYDYSVPDPIIVAPLFCPIGNEKRINFDSFSATSVPGITFSGSYSVQNFSSTFPALTGTDGPSIAFMTNGGGSVLTMSINIDPNTYKTDRFAFDYFGGPCEVRVYDQNDVLLTTQLILDSSGFTSWTPGIQYTTGQHPTVGNIKRIDFRIDPGVSIAFDKFHFSCFNGTSPSGSWGTA